VTDQRVAVGLYSIFGVLLCASWWAFFQYLARHPELLEEGVAAEFFRRERTRAWVGIVCYVVAGMLGLLFIPVALAIFLALPIYFAITSHGLDALPQLVQRVGVPAVTRRRDAAAP